jgi:hypothetical protein
MTGLFSRHDTGASESFSLEIPPVRHRTRQSGTFDELSVIDQSNLF